ncbi:acyltransferase-domain-containing protein [Laetiporus sulphureus 93-53]|uniref:Tafazzin family protein n=1 Tax=Laetiporus sulphureus 93-53 TaxID=1314785 RepID=A0A165B2P9_9APHY|nr:acyltransferase-domain-containing protein [Laetiporus sulphureus 93-53]KZT00113.1 acyltransferase-domain-containing protein [Laetiporus sulphureus 93-53]
MSSTLSKATVTAVGLLSKAFLNVGYCSSVSVNGLDNLLEALNSDERTSGRGIITVANHLSILDDPLIWGVLPAKFYLESHFTRWTLGASDIMFTNPIFSMFFRNGQVIETFRGKGIFQPAVDTAIHKLNHGAWIHLFGEGKVNQPAFNPSHDSLKLLRFKWGVGRILMETAKPPVIIPIWLTGFDKLMPEQRLIPWKFFPRPRVALSITFGAQVDTDKMRDTLARMIREERLPEVPRTSHGGLSDTHRPEDERISVQMTGHWLRDVWMIKADEFGVQGPARLHTVQKVASIRSALTALVQQQVEELGRKVTSEKAAL